MIKEVYYATLILKSICKGIEKLVYLDEYKFEKSQLMLGHMQKNSLLIKIPLANIQTLLKI